MFHIFKLAAQVLLRQYTLTDKNSCKKFLIEMISLVKPLAAANKIKLDETVLSHLEFVLNNDALFAYVYNLICEQLQTHEVLLEAADEDTILELCENTVSANTKYPEAINPVLVISLITQIVSIINAVKNK